MKLGYWLANWPGGPPPDAAQIVAEADSLGCDSVWTAEAYGQDCLSPLAWWGAGTRRVRLGTGLMQMAARTPAAAAMAAMTMDHLSGGRFILGLGASGPQVVEGWYGQPYQRPLARTREYIEIVRAIIARREPVRFNGEFHQLPLPGGTGLAKPLRSSIHPVRAEIPIFLGAEGPKNIALAAEIADGWMPLFYSPKADAYYRAALMEGFGRPGARRTPGDFEVAAAVPVVVDEDVDRARDAVRQHVALYVGGMGAKGANFHFDVLGRMGYSDVAADIQRLFLSGRKREAASAVPTAMVEDIALVGPADKIRDDLAAWRDTVITTMVILGDGLALRTMAELAAG